MSNFSGFRCAIDADSSRQFLIQFRHGEIVNVRMYAEDPRENVLRDGVYDALIDDEAHADGTHTVYAIQVAGGRVVNFSQEEGVSVSDPMLAQRLAQKAYLPRREIGPALAQQPEPAPAPRPQAPVAQQPAQQQNPFNKYATQTQPAVRPAASRIPPEPASPKVAASTIEDLIKKYGEDLTATAAAGQSDPVIGREDERKKIQTYLLRRNRSSVAVIGEPGTGKTTIANGLAQDIIAGNVPEGLQGARIVSINLQGMLAGTQFRGEFEKRLMPILNGLKERGGYLKGQKIILFFDEMHSALAAGGNTQGGSSAAEMLKPFLASKEITCIGTTTIEEYRKFIEKDGALNRRFQPLMYDEPGKDETLEIVKRTRDMFATHHYLDQPLTDEQVAMIIDLTDRYMPTRFNPDKSLGIMDAASANVQREGRKVVTDDDIRRCIEAEAKLPEGSLDTNELQKYVSFAGKAKENIYGQDEAVDYVHETLLAAKTGMRDPSQPIGSFLFVGPTGVGKTELTKEIARQIFGDINAMSKFDMSEFQDKHSVSGLIGSPPGFVGSDDATQAKLLEAVKRKPYQVILFDEVEKAHPDIYNILLAVLNDGKLKDKHGKDVDFSNTVIVMTSNLGAKEMIAAIQGKVSSYSFSAEDPVTHDDEVTPEMKKTIRTITEKSVQKFFRPEFIQRVEELGGTVQFYPLTKTSADPVMRKELKRAFNSVSKDPTGINLSNVTFTISKDVEKVLMDSGFKPEFGARPMKGAVKKVLGNPLAVWLLENESMLRAAGNVTVHVEKLDPSARGADRLDVRVISETPEQKKLPAPRKTPARSKAVKRAS